MSARDELAREITTFRERWFGSLGGGSPKEDVQIADHILAAGYSKPRTITTVTELDALHAKAVILDPNGTPWVCDGDMVEPWASVCEDPFGGPIWKNSRDIALPATVIHEAAA